MLFRFCTSEARLNNPLPSDTYTEECPFVLFFGNKKCWWCSSAINNDNIIHINYRHISGRRSACWSIHTTPYSLHTKPSSSKVAWRFSCNSVLSATVKISCKIRQPVGSIIITMFPHCCGGAHLLSLQIGECAESYHLSDPRECRHLNS